MCVGEPGGIGTAYAEHGWEQQDYVAWGGSCLWEAMALPALAVWGKHIIACMVQSWRYDLHKEAYDRVL